MKIKPAKYDAYKDSGVEWLGEIPEHWEVKPGFTILQESKEKNKGFKEQTILSLSYGKVIIKPEEKLTGLVPESFETYQLVTSGDIIIRPTDLQNDVTSLRTGLAKNKGIITSAYINLRVSKKFSDRFYHYYLHTIDVNKVIYGLGSGLRQNISFLDFKRFPFPLPPKNDQTAIANFLDDKIAKIDQAISIKQKQIDLLKERRQIVIHKAVTQGINPNVKLKDSGVEWIGKIPEHWEVKKLKNLVQIKGGFAFDSSKFKDKGIQIIKIANTYMNKLCLDRQPTFVDTSYLNSHRDWIVSKNDILISLTGTLGKKDYGFAILLDTEEIFLLNQRVAKIEVGSPYEPGYILNILQSDMYLNQLYVLPSGTKQANLSNDDVINIKVAFSEVKSERESILKFINDTKLKIFTAISIKEKEIESLKEYKSSLINSLVSGKVKVS